MSENTTKSCSTNKASPCNKKAKIKKLQAQVSKLQYGLTLVQVGTCTCSIERLKPNEHEDTCRYKLIQDIHDGVDFGA